MTMSDLATITEQLNLLGFESEECVELLTRLIAPIKKTEFNPHQVKEFSKSDRDQLLEMLTTLSAELAERP